MNYDLENLFRNSKLNFVSKVKALLKYKMMQVNSWVENTQPLVIVLRIHGV